MLIYQRKIVGSSEDVSELILQTEEEVLANVETGKVADAIVTKGVIGNLITYNDETDSIDVKYNGVVVGSIKCDFKLLNLYTDGKLHKTLSSTGSCSYSLGSGYFRVASQNVARQYPKIWFTDKINFSNFDKIVIDSSGWAKYWGGVILMILDSFSTSEASDALLSKDLVYASTDGEVTQSRNVKTIDISDITGEHYLAFQCTCNSPGYGYADIYNLYLTK